MRDRERLWRGFVWGACTIGNITRSLVSNLLGENLEATYSVFMRAFQVVILTNVIKDIYTVKYISLKTLDYILSNDIIFVL
jgi:hypothetical protein